MKNFISILILILCFNCSSSPDDTNPPIDPTDDSPPPVGTDVVLSQQWETESVAYLPQGMVYDELNRPYLFLAAKGAGLLVLNDNGDLAPTQVAQIPIDDLFSLDVMNIVQRGNYLYLALGDFFGPDVSKSGFAIINISNPTSPIIEDIWESDEVQDGAAIVIVEGDYAYLGAMKFGIYIFDISQPDTIIEKSNYVPNVNFPIENPVGVEVPNARGMDIVGDLLYLCYDAGGIRIIDVSNKEMPDEIENFMNLENQQFTPKAYNNLILNGNYAYVAVDYCGFEIWDISTMGQEELIGWWNPWDCDQFSNVWWNSPGHANQMVYDAENNLLFVNTGRSDLSILDVSIPENPTLKQSHGIFDDTQATWGMTMKNNDIYLLYITAGVPLYSDWSGLKKLNWEFE